MAFATKGQPIASVAVFCPQSKAPDESYLNGLRTFLKTNNNLDRFTHHILGLPDVWSILAGKRHDIANLEQGPRHIKNLSQWVTSGDSSRIANCMSGILSLPLLVIIQVCQYFQYLELHDKSHAEFSAYLRAGGGIQGYCGGLCPAIAIACSKDEAEVVEHAATAMRIALAIGAYGELGDDEAVPGATTIVCRVKRVGQGEELVAKFPGSYISAVTDPKTISIVGPAPVLQKLQTYARTQGFLVQEMHIRGKVHNPENAELAKELCQLCDSTDLLKLPDATKLQIPTRSNRSGDVIVKGSLSHEMVNVILASRCEWYTLLNQCAKDLDLSGRRHHVFATFGIGDCVPLSPFHKYQLQITKVDVQAFVAQNTTGAESNRYSDYRYPRDAIAITGASCRLPGADSLEGLWDLVSSGRSQHTELSTVERFDLYGSFRASQDRKFVDKRKFYGNFIDGAGNFDNAFFGFNPKEAANMDPQQRVLLELAYQAMESSGYLHSHQRESGDPVGCFIGGSFAEYLDNTNAHGPTAYTSTGTIRAFMCGRISYHFGWSGPAEVIDTACSSSLVAIHRACKAILNGECTLALAGGINVMTGINNFLDLAKAGFLSPTGQCKPFDQQADGYCRSEGGGLIVLKQLNQAVSDGDQILGVIPGIATNQGGLSASITIPHSAAQAKLFRTVLHQAGMRPEQVTYIETHGTGTQAGDPLEIASVREVFGGPDRDQNSPLNIGSIKGNIGHAETAAGVAGLLKVLAMMQNRGIPPQASHRSLNEKIPALEVNNMAIATEAIPWEQQLLAAGVNSYGAAGSNAAVICCNYPARGTATATQQIEGLPFPVIVSAASRESLRMNVQSLARYLLKSTPKPTLANLAFTLSRKRKIHRCISVISASGMDSLTNDLTAKVDSMLETPQTPKRIVLAFGGQTKRSVGMSRVLYESYPRLKSYIDECNDIVTALGYETLVPWMFQHEPLTSVVTLQCGTFAMQYACAKCWIDGGLQVDAVIGHSFGELTAMVISGTLSLRDGLKLVACRASLMETKWGQERGTMFVVHCDPKTAHEMLAFVNDLEIACYNAPNSQVVVGSSSTIDRVQSVLEKNQRFSGIRSQRLDVTHGFHSKFTESILDDLQRCSTSLTYREPEIAIEPCTAEPLEDISTSRPSQHAREPVYFSNAVQRVEKRLGPCIWLEAGMDSPIIPMVKRASASSQAHSYQAMKVSDSSQPLISVCDLTANLWREGISVSYWSFIVSKLNPFKQIWLPPYQFQPTNHWLPNIDRTIEAQENVTAEKGTIEKRIPQPKPRPMLVRTKTGTKREDSSKDFKICLDAERFTKIVSGHSVRQRPLCPASMYMECTAMAVQLLQGGLDTGTIQFSNLSFQAALGVDPNREVFLTLENSGRAQGWRFVIKSMDLKSRLSTHARGEVAITAQPDFRPYERLIADRVDELKSKVHTEKLLSNRAYGLFSRVVHYAEFLQGISYITLDKTEAFAKIDLRSSAEIEFDQSTTTHCCETVAIDTFIQVVGLLINSSDLVSSEDVYVATGIESAAMSSACDFHRCKSWTVYAKYAATGDGQAAGDIFVMTEERLLAMVITGAQFTKLLITKLERFLDSANAKPASDSTSKNIVTPHESRSSRETSITETTFDDSEKAETSDTPSSTPPSSIDIQKNEHGDQRRQKVYQLLAETSGAPIESISGKPQLQELGIDSLSAVELKGDLEDAFEVEIEDDRFTLESKVQEILDFLGCGEESQQRPSLGDAALEQPIMGSGGNASNKSDNPSLSGKQIKLADPLGTLSHVQNSFEQAAAGRGFLDYWNSAAPKQDKLLLAYICEAFQALGMDIKSVPLGEQLRIFNYPPRHAKVMNRLVEILEKHDLLTRQGPKLVRAGGQPPHKTSRDLHREFVADFPVYEGEAQLMALTGPRLGDCLAGKADAVGLMFKGATAQKIMGEYYTASPMLSTLTEHMVSFFHKLVSSSDGVSGDARLNILEVGAGFGGTTTRLAEVLQASGMPVRYRFTDISPSLVKAAKTKFAKYSWMEFQPLNLESDMPEDLIGGYDIVIGTNCVHATSDRIKTICNLKRLLNDQGFIVLSEVTQFIDWYDIVFGLLEGWWLAKDGSYPLQSPESWVQTFEEAGFNSGNITYSGGLNPESNTQRLFVASNKRETGANTTSARVGEQPSIRTAVYKEVKDIKVEADIYLPEHNVTGAMPVAIMIHGGGHMTLSRRAVRPFQTAYLLKHGVLPISIDYRLCPEVNLIEGPIEDVCDAFRWVKTGGLQAMVQKHGIRVDASRVVVVGWSTGGHLAMTTAWTSKEAGLPPPQAILSFYGPTDFESGDLDVRRAEEYPERQLSMDKLIASLPTKPITNYSASPSSTDSSHLGWLRQGDPRSELVLSLFKEGNGLPLLLNGIRPSSPTATSASWLSPPSPSRIAAISPLAQLRKGTYTTPTFLIHGTRDEIVPFHTAEVFARALMEEGIKGGLAIVDKARHIHDLGLKEGDDGWQNGVGVGFDFLFQELGLR